MVTQPNPVRQSQLSGAVADATRHESVKAEERNCIKDQFHDRELQNLIRAGPCTTSQPRRNERGGHRTYMRRVTLYLNVLFVPTLALIY